MSSNELLSRRARLAALSRHRGDHDPVTVKARDDLLEESLRIAIRRAVDAWPPLSEERRDRLARLLAPMRQPRPKSKTG